MGIFHCIDDVNQFLAYIPVVEYCVHNDELTALNKPLGTNVQAGVRAVVITNACARYYINVEDVSIKFTWQIQALV